MSYHLLQKLFASRLQRHQHLPPVFPAPRAFHEAVRFHADDKLESTVVLQRQPVRTFADAGLLPGFQPANRQQQKVLLRLKPRLARRRIAFLQEAPYQVSQFG